SRSVTLAPANSLSPSTIYTATLSGAQDLAGNAMATVSWSFTTTAIDSTPPTVIASSPAPGATGVSVASNLTATFSEPVQAGTIGFTLKNGATPVAATASYDPVTHTLTVDPNTNLASGATYTATLGGTLDLSGNPLAGSSWSFTTAAAAAAAPT